MTTLMTLDRVLDDDEPTYEPIQDVAPAAETDPGAEGAAQ